MKTSVKIIACTVFALLLVVSSVLSQEARSPLFTEKKVKNYIPHMTWL